MVKKLWAGICIFFGGIVRFFYTRDPIAVLQYQIDRGAEEASEAKEGLVECRSLQARLQNQVESCTREKARLEEKIKRYITEGKEDRAKEYATRLQRERDQLASNEEQLKIQEGVYNDYRAKVRAINERIADAQDNASRLDAELSMSKAEAATADLISSMNVKVSGNALNGLGEAEQEIRRQIERNRAKVHVAKDIGDMEEYEEEESERAAEAEDILAELRSEVEGHEPQEQEKEIGT